MSVWCFARVVSWCSRILSDDVAARRWKRGCRGLPVIGLVAVSALCAGRAVAEAEITGPLDGEGRIIASGDPVPAASYVPCLPGSGGDLTSDAKSPLVVTVDTSRKRQTIRGFGASDAWSIQFVGQWPAARREAIADLLFDTALDGHKNPKGIGLSAWRFSVGAGSSRQSNISDSWRRADTFLNSGFDGYDWSRCPGQRWFLQAAKARGVGRFIAFVNSPPINMTRNGNAFCSENAGTTNLKDDKTADFAAYLAAILQHFRDVEGIDFEAISPFNEPNWDWNNAGQEGCRYANADIKKVVVALYQQLKSQQSATQIELPEAGDITYLYSGPEDNGKYIAGFFFRWSPWYVGDKVAFRVAGHSYYSCWPDNNRLVGFRRKLRSTLDEYPGLDYAMTEYCILVPGDSWVPAAYRNYGSGRDLGIDPALWVARVIHYDLTVAEASDWQWWLAVSPYDYKDGLVYIDKSETNGNYRDSKMLWAMGNFSRFIRPGMTRVVVGRSDDATPESTVEGLMVSAYWKKEDGTIVVVFVNRAREDKPVKLDFPGAAVRCLVPYVTRGNSSTADNLTAYGALSPDDVVAIPARSIVTVVATPGNFGDWDRDLTVDFRDFAVLASRWLGIDGGRRVGFRELGDWAACWLRDFRLAAHWRLDETSGAVARDDAGVNDGTLQGEPAWQPAAGRVGGALLLDGIDDCVRTPLALDPATEKFSVFAWVRGGAAGQVIVSQWAGTNWLLAAADGTLKTDLKAGGRQGKSLGCAAVITDGDWHEVGLAWDGACRILCVDGAEVARDTQAAPQSSTQTLWIGAGSTTASTTLWKGLIDDVRVYDRVVAP